VFRDGPPALSPRRKTPKTCLDSLVARQRLGGVAQGVEEDVAVEEGRHLIPAAAEDGAGAGVGIQQLEVGRGEGEVPIRVPQSVHPKQEEGQVCRAESHPARSIGAELRYLGCRGAGDFFTRSATGAVPLRRWGARSHARGPCFRLCRLCSTRSGSRFRGVPKHGCPIGSPRGDTLHLPRASVSLCAGGESKVKRPLCFAFVQY